ncbi:MAG: beta-ketoacyl-ACP synthase II, partial [Anaerolineae bacterium]|nr:beta-ketoacyl-ACP synthase II [Anaerolineae bacterium]
MSELHRVVVTGLGAVTPLGNTVSETWNALVAGKSGCGLITLFDTADYEVKIACEVKGFDPVSHFGAKEARRLDRFAQFALVAAREALQDAGLTITAANRDRVAVLTGSALGGSISTLQEHTALLERGPRRVSPFAIPMLLADAASGQLSIAFGIRGLNLNIASACASAANAIGEAMWLIRTGRADVVLAGGSEAPIHPFILTAFHNMNALSTDTTPERASRPFDATRNGFVIGEGAAFVVLESLAHAQARSAQVLAELSGYGATSDAGHITAPDVGGAAEAVRLALHDAGVRPEQVDYINAHGTSTPLNDRNETEAIKRVFGEHAYRVPISSTKSMTGHLLGATGALELIVCVKAIQTGCIPPTIN